MMSTFVATMKYIQGPGAVKEIAGCLGEVGDKVLLLADDFVSGLVGVPLAESMRAKGIRLETARFSGECSKAEIDRLSALADKASIRIILAAGGGKALDTGKAVAGRLGAVCAVLPTTASTDSPTSSIAVTYREDHTYEGVLKVGRNPDFVFVDSEIIARAPIRFLAAGMGDALATKFEARACHEAGRTNLSGGSITRAGLALADLCYSTVRTYGAAGKKAAERGVVTPELEALIEANILLSGLGWENCGVAVAHAFNGAATVVGRSQGAMHGERVSFGLLVQFVLERRSAEETEDLLGFYREIGLPMTFAELGLRDPQEEELDLIAKAITKPGSHAHNMPFPLNEATVRKALVSADLLGSRFKESGSIR